MPTVARLYDTYADAVAVVTDLESSNLGPDAEISLIASEKATGRDTTVETQHTKASAAGTGAGAGAAVGGIVGILAGLGMLAIPGIGPLVAAGWLATTAAGAGVGAAAGGLIGALTSAGLHHDEAETYEEGIRRGGTLVAVRADAALIPRIEQVMDTRVSPAWQQRRESYITSGWKPSRV